MSPLFAKEYRFLWALGVVLVSALVLRITSDSTTISPTVSTAPHALPVAFSASTSSQERIAWPVSVSSTARIVRVVDGDTVEALLDGQVSSSKIRLLGVNTPESVDPRRAVQCFGKEASLFMKHLVEGKRVFMVEDPQADDRDKYGRLLRGLVMEDGTDVNATLVASGYASAYLSFPLNKARKVQLSRLQEEAKREQRGLWSPATCNGDTRT